MQHKTGSPKIFGYGVRSFRNGFQPKSSTFDRSRQRSRPKEQLQLLKFPLRGISDLYQSRKLQFNSYISCGKTFHQRGRRQCFNSTNVNKRFSFVRSNCGPPINLICPDRVVRELSHRPYTSRKNNMNLVVWKTPCLWRCRCSKIATDSMMVYDRRGGVRIEMPDAPAHEELHATAVPRALTKHEKETYSNGYSGATLLL